MGLLNKILSTVILLLNDIIRFYYYFSLAIGIITALGSPLIAWCAQIFMRWLVTGSPGAEPIVFPEHYILSRSIILTLGGLWLAGGIRLWWKVRKSDYYAEMSFVTLGRANFVIMWVPWIGWFLATFMLFGGLGETATAFAQGRPGETSGFS